MCCLFGLIDYRNTLTAKEKNRTIHSLATAAEAWGTDAAGIAYCSRGAIQVYKRPVPGHCLRARLPQNVPVIMGHTRLTTQGSAKKNFNNHPFRATAGKTSFALAHNGMIYNDLELRRKEKLPRTKIRTDSYVAVQLLEHSGDIHAATLAAMAEKLDGSFSITVLDHQNNLYFIKGNNPLCIYHLPNQGIYVYASTREILDRALLPLPFLWVRREEVTLVCGDILQIDASGKLARSHFDTCRLWWGGWSSSACVLPTWNGVKRTAHTENGKSDYVQALYSVAGSFGLSPWTIDQLLQDGFTEEEIEDYLYCGEV